METPKKAVRRSASRVDCLEPRLGPMRELGIVRNFQFREEEDVMGYLSGLQFSDVELMVRRALTAAREAADAFPQCTEHQRFVIALYTCDNGTDANYHALLNQRLRGRLHLEPILPLVYLTDTAIRRMGGWRGTVYRGVGFLADLERYQIGAVVCWAQVNSTTTNKAMATDTFMFGKPDRTLFVITVIDGADIRRVSLKPEECEVLLPVCSEFKVTLVEWLDLNSAGPALVVHLKQLPTPPLFRAGPRAPQQDVPLRELGVVRNFRFNEQEDFMGYLSGLPLLDKEVVVQLAQEAAREAATDFPQCTEHQLVALALASHYHTVLNRQLRSTPDGGWASPERQELEPILPLVYLTDTAIRRMGGWRGTAYRGVGFLVDLDQYQVRAHFAQCPPIF